MQQLAGSDMGSAGNLSIESKDLSSPSAPGAGGEIHELLTMNQAKTHGFLGVVTHASG